MKKKGFTLIEVILVVTILGILAAVVLPTFSDQTAVAKEAAAKSNLMTIRSQIELYKLQHNGFPPGYLNSALTSDLNLLESQFIGTSAVTGQAIAGTVPSSPFLYGPYLKKIPKNPFNNKSNIAIVLQATAFSSAVNGTSSGWLYKRETGEFVINWTGTDHEGVAFYNY